LQVFLLADRPQPKVEEPPQMRNYLTWLEMGGPAEVLTPQIVEPAPPVAVPTVKPPSVPVAAPVENNRKRQKSRPPMPERSTGKPRKEPGTGPRVIDIPMAKPFAAPPPMPTASAQAVAPAPPKAEAFDVELVPMPPPANIPQIPTSAASEANSAAKWLGLSTREWMLIAIGAGMALGIVLVAVVVWALVSSGS
ncbi:MAG: hypothetical protein HY040_22855, partial [Planctomycetes bacterium]|nr:hypothetical protein [Planctomycetota bacterium]